MGLTAPEFVVSSRAGVARVEGQTRVEVLKRARGIEDRNVGFPDEKFERIAASVGIFDDEGRRARFQLWWNFDDQGLDTALAATNAVIAT